MSEFPDEDVDDWGAPPPATEIPAQQEEIAKLATEVEQKTTIESQPATPVATEATPSEAGKKKKKKGREELQQVFSTNRSKLLDVGTVDLQVQQADSSSPLYAALEFSAIGEKTKCHPIKGEVLAAAFEMGYKKPSKIQATALPFLLRGDGDDMEDMIFQSQAGTGKTAAFALNILTRCHEGASVQALYVAPTFQLMYQTQHVFKALGSKTNLTVGVLFGTGPRHMQQEQNELNNIARQRGACTNEIVCATLDKAIQTLKQGRKMDPSRIQYLVIDEADDFLMNQDNFQKLLQLRKILPGLKQTTLLSATFTEDTLDLARKMAPKANIIKLPIEEVIRENVKQWSMPLPTIDHKLDALKAIYDILDVEQCIVFCNTRQSASKLRDLFESLGHLVCVLVGGQQMSREEQLKELDRFIRKEAKVLVTTNILARGIDIDQMSMVVNFDVPTKPVDADRRHFVADPETYVHRVGRCGRFGSKGTAITFVSSRQEAAYLEDISQSYKLSVQQLDSPFQLNATKDDE